MSLKAPGLTGIEWSPSRPLKSATSLAGCATTHSVVQLLSLDSASTGAIVIPSWITGTHPTHTAVNVLLICAKLSSCIQM